MSERTFGNALGSLFGAVTTTMDTAGKIVDVAATSTDVLGYKLAAWSETARLDALIQMDEAKTVAATRAADRNVQRRLDLDAKCKNPRYAKLYREELDRINTILDPSYTSVIALKEAS